MIQIVSLRLQTHTPHLQPKQSYLAILLFRLAPHPLLKMQNLLGTTVSLHPTLPKLTQPPRHPLVYRPQAKHPRTNISYPVRELKGSHGIHSKAPINRAKLEMKSQPILPSSFHTAMKIFVSTG